MLNLRSKERFKPITITRATSTQKVLILLQTCSNSQLRDRSNTRHRHSTIRSSRRQQTTKPVRRRRDNSHRMRNTQIRISSSIRSNRWGVCTKLRRRISEDTRSSKTIQRSNGVTIRHRRRNNSTQIRIHNLKKQITTIVRTVGACHSIRIELRFKIGIKILQVTITLRKITRRRSLRNLIIRRSRRTNMIKIPRRRPSKRIRLPLRKRIIIANYIPI